MVLQKLIHTYDINVIVGILLLFFLVLFDVLKPFGTYNARAVVTIVLAGTASTIIVLSQRGQLVSSSSRESSDASELQRLHKHVLVPKITAFFYDPEILNIGSPLIDLQYCVLDPKIVRTLLQVIKFHDKDCQSVFKIVYLTEQFYKTYARLIQRPRNRNRIPSDSIDRDVSSMVMYRQQLINHAYTLHISSDAESTIQKIIRTLQSRTYKCLNTLGNKFDLNYKNPKGLCSFSESGSSSFALFT